MEQPTSTYLHILNSDQLSDGTQLLHVKELPPPYSTIERELTQYNVNDWKDEFINIKPLHDDLYRYGFNISGGIDTNLGPAIRVTQIENDSKTCPDNGRTSLRLFDRILAVNGINLTNVTHAVAVRAFNSTPGQTISLHIRRLNLKRVEHIDILFPNSILDQPLGIGIIGGIDENTEDSGLFVSRIDPNGLLVSSIKKNQLCVGDRLLEIKTNYTSANLECITQSIGGQLIRRICQDHLHVTLVVARRNLT